jgi:hypothetical protein
MQKNNRFKRIKLLFKSHFVFNLMELSIKKIMQNFTRLTVNESNKDEIKIKWRRQILYLLIDFLIF